VVKRNLQKSNILEQVKEDLLLLKNFEINSVETFSIKLQNSEVFIRQNNILQKNYDKLKKEIENEA